MFRSIVNKIIASIILIAAIVTIYTGYEQFRDKKQTITINTILIENLTNKKNLNLKTLDNNKYSLWKIYCRIKNVGEMPIIGKGSLKTIINDTLKLTVYNSIGIERMSAYHNFPINNFYETKLNLVDYSIDILFLQWLPNNYIDFELIVKTKNKLKPEISINKYQLINTNVIYRKGLAEKEDKFHIVQNSFNKIPGTRYLTINKIKEQVK